MSTTPQTVATLILPGSFDASKHWYPKALNATIHPMVHFFLHLTKERILSRYCHLHPMTDAAALDEILSYTCKYFHWAGADLLNVTSAKGRRQMVVIENNSCPSGQKSMPLMDDSKEHGGYYALIENSFIPFLKKATLKGAIAVVYDKNPMEAQGYASTIAELSKETVYFVPWYDGDPSPGVRFTDGVMEVYASSGAWVPIRAAFRYLTQRPWNRIPLQTKTRIFNPISVCLAGGRNKMMAAKAYAAFNESMGVQNDLRILTPETIWDVTKEEVPGIVKSFGGQAVVKIPYSNAGQGVFTIVTPQELEDFMASDFPYDRFIVQSLIGNYHWSSTSAASGKLYQVGTIPNKKGETYVADLRVMVSNTEKGLRPIAVYARQAAIPLVDHIQEGQQSWDMLGTNLSFKNKNGEWDTDTNRLILMDRRDFNKLGIGVDDLIEAYIQTVLSTIAIDKRVESLLNKQGKFSLRRFAEGNEDPRLLKEIRVN